MEIPKVFISSTCYDLSEVRRQLEEFLQGHLGYEAVMSDTSSFKVAKHKDAIDVCLDLIPECHFLVLIIGNRYGSKMQREGKSITNKEYEVAAKNGLLIYPFVKKDVWTSLQIYNQNPGKDVTFPFVDDPQLFEFINEVKTASKDNFIWTFDNASDIVDVLRKQFAYLFNDLLNNMMRVHSVEKHFEGRNKCIVAIRLGWLLRQIIIFLPLGNFTPKRVHDALHLISEILYGYELFISNNEDEVAEFKKVKESILDGSFAIKLQNGDIRDSLIRLQLNQIHMEQELSMRLSGVYKYYFMLGHTLAQITLSLTSDKNNEYEQSKQDQFLLFRNQIDRCLQNLNLSRGLVDRIHKLTDTLGPKSSYEEYFPEAQNIIGQISIFLEN